MTGVAGPRLPKTLRVEAKFTTGTLITIPKREREALMGHDPEVVGAVAALFWSGRWDVDGRWFIVDIESLPAVSSLSAINLQRLARNQPRLANVREHLNRTWVPFLAAFVDRSFAGHKALQVELKELHDEGTLSQQLSTADVLEYEHRNSVQAIVNHHGALVAGHIFQDLLAYLLALAGYRTVRINPVGVPDIEVSDLVDFAAGSK